jgi:hypothetical protein
VPAGAVQLTETLPVPAVCAPETPVGALRVPVVAEPVPEPAVEKYAAATPVPANKTAVATITTQAT